MPFKNLILSLILIFSSKLIAAETNTTIKDNILELRESIKIADHHDPKKFNELLTVVYDDLADRIHRIEEEMGNQKTALTVKMHEEHTSIQKDIVAYKQATRKKAKALRPYIVNKLEQLFRQVEAHFKDE